MINDIPSQFPSQSQSSRNTANKNVDSGLDNHETHSKISNINSKKARLMVEPDLYSKAPATVSSDSGIHVYNLNFSEKNTLKDALEVTHAVPDVAAAIEDLLNDDKLMVWYASIYFYKFSFTPRI